MVLDVSHRDNIKTDHGLQGSLQRHGLCVGCGYQEEFNLALELESLFDREVQHLPIPYLPNY
jgi:hypothetical protein